MSMIYRTKKDLIKSLIKNSDVVLDVGFWGQGIQIDDENWVHNLLKKKSKKVYGLDIDFDSTKLNCIENYKKSSAENFDFDKKFDVIFAGDVIEHLSNMGLFLDSCGRNLEENGRLVITTPNCFNLFNLAEKIAKYEPTVNSDHTCYFNIKTIKQLLEKNKWGVLEVSYLYTLSIDYRESCKKKILNLLYYLLSKITSKYVETIVVVARRM